MAEIKRVFIVICTIIGLVAVISFVVLRLTKESPLPVYQINVNEQAIMSSSSKTFSIASSAFSNNSPIPKEYTCDGEEISPSLDISGVPSRAKSLVLILDDPDSPGGTFTHWVVFDIPPSTAKIQEGMLNTSITFGVPGRNSAGSSAYVGPCPPSGTHHYHFKLYALSEKLGLPGGSTKEQVLAAMDGYVIGTAELVGTYGR